MMRLRKISLTIFFVLLAVLSYFMLTPSPPEINVEFRFMDKVEHFAAFLILTVLLLFSIKPQAAGKKRMFIFSGAVLAFYGILMEVIQRYTGRTAEFADLIADLAGIAAGCFLSLFFL